jgi:hypothetical protein
MPLVSYAVPHTLRTTRPSCLHIQQHCYCRPIATAARGMVLCAAHFEPNADTHLDAFAAVPLIPKLACLQQYSHSIRSGCQAAAQLPLAFLQLHSTTTVITTAAAAAAAAKQALPAACQQVASPAAPAQLFPPHARLPVSWVARVKADRGLGCQAARRLAHSPYAVDIIISVSCLVSTWATARCRSRA